MQIRVIRDFIKQRRKGEFLREALAPVILHATRTNAGVVGINNEVFGGINGEVTSFTDKMGKLRLIGRIKSYAKDKG